jgi:hypothetical protein
LKKKGAWSMLDLYLNCVLSFFVPFDKFHLSEPDNVIAALLLTRGFQLEKKFTTSRSLQQERKN